MSPSVHMILRADSFSCSIVVYCSFLMCSYHKNYFSLEQFVMGKKNIAVVVSTLGNDNRILSLIRIE
jgi:hypothetical protein